jgi:hypothetical protein
MISCYRIGNCADGLGSAASKAAIGLTAGMQTEISVTILCWPGYALGESLKRAGVLPFCCIIGRWAA